MTIMGLIYLSSITGVLILLLISVINRNINAKNFLFFIIFSGLLILSAFHSLSNNVGTFGKDSSSEYYVIRKTIVNEGFREIESAFEAALSVSLTIPILLIITNMRFISFYNFIYPLFILIDIIIFYRIAKRIFNDEKISFFSTIFYIANYWILTYSLSMLRAGIAYILLHCLYLNILRSKNDQQKHILLVSMLLSIGIIVSYYSLVIPFILTLLLTEIVEIKQKRSYAFPILSISLIVFSFLYLMYYAIISGQHIIGAFHNLISFYEERYHTKVSLIEPPPQAETSLKVIGQQLKLATFITNYLLALANYFLFMKKKYTLSSHRKFFYLSTASLVTFIVTSPSAFVWGIINFSYYYHWVIALLISYFIYVVHYSKKATVRGFLKIFLLLVMLINMLNTTFVTDYLCGLSNSYILDTIWNNSLNLFTMRFSDYYALTFIAHYSEYTKILVDCDNVAHVYYVLAEYFTLSNKIVTTTTSYHALSSNPSIVKGVYIYLSNFNVRTESLYLHMPGVGYGIPLNISSSLNMTDIIYNSCAQIRFGGNI